MRLFSTCSIPEYSHGARSSLLALFAAVSLVSVAFLASLLCALVRPPSGDNLCALIDCWRSIERRGDLWEDTYATVESDANFALPRST